MTMWACTVVAAVEYVKDPAQDQGQVSAHVTDLVGAGRARRESFIQLLVNADIHVKDPPFCGKEKEGQISWGSVYVFARQVNEVGRRARAVSFTEAERSRNGARSLARPFPSCPVTWPYGKGRGRQLEALILPMCATFMAG